jgi:hypothetical protein
MENMVAMTALESKITGALAALALFAAGAVSAADDTGKITDDGAAKFGCVPIPKEMSVGKGTLTFKGPFRIVCDSEDESGYSDWLAAGMKRLFGWTSRAQKPGFEIEIKHQDLGHGPEAYKIDIAKGKITLTCAGPDADFRAAGRLLSIFEADFFRPGAAPGTLECPPLRVTDWPDMPNRGMMLQMAFDSGRPSNIRMSIIRRSIEMMARLGFNFVVLEPGGCFESENFTAPKGCWTKMELRELVGLASSRGLKVYPAINSVGHVERAPKLFLLNDAKGRPVAMDITNPRFYQEYFDVVDELSSIFGNPAYFMIGADEAKAALAKLSAVTGRKPEDLYSEFLKKAAAGFAARKTRPVIWHDMLLSPSEDDGANGQDTFTARETLDKSFVIDYWCYDARGNYRGLEALVKTGNEIWASPWSSRAGIKCLVQDAVRLGVKTILGTTWSGPEQSASAFVSTAEFTWNAKRAGFNPSYLPAAVFGQLFNGRPDHLQAAAAPLEIKGPSAKPGDLKMEPKITAGGLVFPADKQVSAGRAQPSALNSPEDVRKAAAKGSAVYIADPANRASGMKINGVNTARGVRQVILYTPSFGKNTGTNTAGLEWIIRNGKVEKFAHGSFEGGSQPIPEDGAVISVHDFAGPSDWLRAELTLGTPVSFVSVPEPPDTAPAEFQIQIPYGAKGAALALGAEFLKAGGNSLLGKVTARYAGGGSPETEITEDFVTLSSPPSGDGSFIRWTAWPDFKVPAETNPLAVLEWRKTKTQDCPASLTIQITPEGRRAGLTAVSAVSW